MEAAAAGSGTHAVVFLHETGSKGMCGFAPFAHWLTTHENVQALLVNRCNYGTSDCASDAERRDIRAQTQPAVDWVRAHGATSVTLIGASSGGTDAVDAAAVDTGVTSLVNISGDGNDTGMDDAALYPKVTVPALFVISPDDPYVTIDQFTSVYDALGSKTRRFVVDSKRPGLHGWDLLMTPAGTPSTAATTIAEWITASG